ncbi:MAG: redoxin domain-containing protein [Solirubrobacteraceae bacterium]
MNAFVLVSRSVLAVVFLLAGVAKLFDLPGSRRAVRAFGVPEGLAGAVATALPILELAVGVALVLPGSSSRWAAGIGAGLMFLFAAAITRAIVRGEAPDCHCFGQLHSAPAGPAALVRNLALGSLAGFVAVMGRNGSLTGWIGPLSATQDQLLVGGAGLVLAVVILAWFCWQLLGQQGRLLLRIETLERAALPSGGRQTGLPPAGLAVGLPAPEFSLPDRRGGLVTLASLRRRQKPVLLVFSDPGCGPCQALLPELAKLERRHRDALTLVLVSRRSERENQAKRSEHHLGRVLLQDDREVAVAFEAHGTPSAVLISREGLISSPLARGGTEIIALLERAGHAAPALEILGANGHHPVQAAPPRRAGEPAPDFALPDTEGSLVSLSDQRGRMTLLVFWNPSCGFCRSMLPELQALDQDPPDGAPALILISGGRVEEHRAMGLRAPVLSDASGRVMSGFQAGGTPSGLLIDETGRVGSELAVGAPAIFALAADRGATV